VLNAHPRSVHHAQSAFRFGLPNVCRLAEPENCLRHILPWTALHQHNSKAKFGIQDPLLRGFAVLSGRLLNTLREALPLCIQNAKVELRFRIPLFSRQPEP
jgi:hypothetical protein